jgi:signal transduction histidine kinase
MTRRLAVRYGQRAATSTARRMMISPLRALVALVVMLASALVAAAAPLQPGDERRVLGGEVVSYLRDPGGLLSIEELVQPALQQRFMPLQRGLNFGFTRDVIWLRITLQRTPQSPADMRLELTSWVLNDVRFFSPESAGFRQSQAGDTFAFADRELDYRSPLFRVVLPDAAPRTFYLRLESDATLSGTLVLWDAASFRTAVQKELLLLGLALGLIAATVLLGLADWLLNREPLQATLSVINLLLLALVLGYSGLANQYFLANSPRLGDALPPLAFALFAASAITVFRHLLRIPDMSSMLDRALLFIAAMCLLLPIVSWSGGIRFGNGVGNFMFLAGVLINLVAALLHWRRGRRGAGLFMVAFGSFALSVCLLMLTSLGLAPWLNDLREASLYAGSVAFSLAALLAVLNEGSMARAGRARALLDAAAQQTHALQEQRLREEQTNFFSFVAHELRTPLGIVRAGLHNLEHDLADTGSHIRERLGRLHRAAERAGLLIERHLQLQRLSRADFVLTLAPVAPAAPAEAALAMAAESFPRRRFEVVLAADLPARVAVDAELVTLALLNLLSNAAKYSPAATPACLSVDVEGGVLRYSVHDLGDGIPAAELERVFEMFRRAPAAADQMGFGIGLALANRVAALHGGSLDHAATKPAGTRFTLTVPGAAAAEEGMPR